MKSFILTAIIAIVSIVASAQSSKQVTWKYSAKKMGYRIYEVRMTAVLPDGWRIYAQGPGIEATRFFFNSNPLTTMDGVPKEIGKLIIPQTKYNSGKCYEKTVSFAQKVILKEDSATIVSGNIRFSVYNKNTNQILPYSQVAFSIKVGG